MAGLRLCLPRSLIQSEWINCFDRDDVLYDVGANIGIFTIYAAVTGKAGKVLAFEPEFQNYAVLNKNVFRNDLQEKVTCLNIALSDVNKLDFLYLSNVSAGGSGHNFGAPPDRDGRPSEAAFRQGAISYSLDEFIERYNPEFPNRIKIDVDGLESWIIRGARNTLSDGRLKSLLIEIDEKLKENAGIVDEIVALGFKVSSRRECSENSKVFNYIFLRTPVQ